MTCPEYSPSHGDMKKTHDRKRYYFYNHIKRALAHEIHLYHIHQREVIKTQELSPQEVQQLKNLSVSSNSKTTAGDISNGEKQQVSNNKNIDKENQKVSSSMKRNTSFIEKHRQSKRNTHSENRIFYYMHYKYQEGFTNAVNRPTIISQYL